MTQSRSSLKIGAFGAAALVSAVPFGAAQAQTVVTFEGTVLESCILTVGTPGVLATSSAGTEIGSLISGGVAATLNVVATGGAPTINFAAPAMSARPAEYSGTPTVTLAYTSTGGANQAHTSAQSQYTSNNAVLDNITLHARAVDSMGFAAGNYTIRTTATCEQ